MRFHDRDVAKTCMKVGTAMILLVAIIWAFTGGEGPSGRIAQAKGAAMLGVGAILFGAYRWFFPSVDN